MKDNFCIVPWIHLNTEPTGTVKPCCAYKSTDSDAWPKLQSSSLEETWNCESQKQMRREFLNNNIPEGCKTCVQKEESSGHSMRMAMNERFSNHIDNAKNNTEKDGTYQNFNLIYWDFRFSNICNFKCRMCGHGLSSSWWEETYHKKNLVKILDSKYYGVDLMTYVDEFIDTVEEIYFAGGEPLMMPEHYVILDKLIERKRFNVRLRYNTNLSTLKYKNYDLIEIWKKFDKVDIFASIDGIEENAEYTRSGTDWQRVEYNLQKLIELSHSTPSINLLIGPTIHILNVFHFPALVNKLLKMNVHPGKFVVSNLLWPDHLKIALLPNNLKDQLKLEYAKQLETINNLQIRGIVEEKYKSILYFLDQPTNKKDLTQFVKDTIKLDISRKESIHNASPELSDWFNTLLQDPEVIEVLKYQGLINE